MVAPTRQHRSGVSPNMPSREYQKELQAFWAVRCKELLQERATVNDEEMTYLVEKLSSMKDEKLVGIVSSLIGWGDDERAELETFCAIAIECFGLVSPSKLREATTKVELRYLIKDK